ncbi:MAG TPA: hypothetical protein VGA08_02540 [Candidatus Saccharimonadales bacterium]
MFSIALLLTTAQEVYADHTIQHCADQTGSENNQDYIDCVNNIGGEVDTLESNPIFKRLADIVNFLGLGVAIAVTGLLVVGGIQYITSAGNPQQISSAKSRIRNALIALVLYIFMYAILQWAVPGGIF